MKTIATALVLLNLFSPVYAEDLAKPPTVPNVLVEQRTENERYPQQVTVRRDGNKIVEEYRIKGVLTMVKVIPKSGAPYFLYNDGEWHAPPGQNGLENPSTAFWRIISW